MMRITMRMHEILDFARLPPLMHKYTIYRHGLPTDGSDNGDLCTESSSVRIASGLHVNQCL